jgi:uncharacterized protein YkwD
VAQTVAACPNATDTVDTVGPGAVRDAVECAVNTIRSEHRLAQLVPSATLAVAAQRHGVDMVTRRYFAHVSPSGGTIEKRARRAGYMRGRCWVVGENLGVAAAASASAQEVVEAWMDSPSHRAIIMDPEFRHMGLAVVAGAAADDVAGSTFVLDVGSNDCAFPVGAAQVRARPRVRAG